MKLQLSKTTPARKKTVRFKWAYQNFFCYTPKFRQIIRDKGLGCDWCGREFADEEWFALACPMDYQEGPKRNWALCHTCAASMGAPDKPRKDQMSNAETCCENCGGSGIISHNPNLNPNSFDGTATAKCTRCGGTEIEEMAIPDAEDGKDNAKKEGR